MTRKEEGEGRAGRHDRQTSRERQRKGTAQLAALSNVCGAWPAESEMQAHGSATGTVAAGCNRSKGELQVTRKVGESGQVKRRGNISRQTNKQSVCSALLLSRFAFCPPLRRPSRYLPIRWICPWIASFPWLVVAPHTGEKGLGGRRPLCQQRDRVC